MPVMMKMEIWQQRYPDIGFFLTFFPYEKTQLEKSPEVLEKWLAKQNLVAIEVLYIVGLIGFALPKEVTNWLSEKKQRALVFVEDDLGSFASFPDLALIQHPQVYFHYARENPIEALAQQFPTDLLAVFSQKPFDASALKRKSSTLSALYSDVLYSHKIVENVRTNFQRLSGCFHFSKPFGKIPAVICGAGPSLAKTFSALQSVKDKALIFAGGSAIAALTQNGIQPHFSLALDPNEEEFDRLKQANYFEGPFLFGPRMHRHVFCTSNGPYGYVKSDTGGELEALLEKELNIEGMPIGPDLGPEAFSVITFAVAYAYAMGCDPILFAGVDLAYTGGKRYAKGVKAPEWIEEDPRALEERMWEKDIHGNEVQTLRKWVMESDCISVFARNHPDVQWGNCTEGGIGFSQIPNVSLEEALVGAQPKDLEGQVHQWIQASPLHIEAKNSLQIYTQIHHSLKRCETLCQSIIELLEANSQSGKLALYQSDLTEELAFQWLLEGVDLALSRILFRYYPHLDPNEGKRQCEQAKYHELKRQIGLFQPIFQKEKVYA